jgi:phosphatidate cytidylyltransferase
MILRVIAIYTSAFFLGGMGLFFASRRQPALVRRARLVKFVTYFCVVNSVLFAALAGRWVFSALLALIAILGVRELSRVVLGSGGGSHMKAGATALTYLMVAASAVAFAWFSTKEAAIFVFMIVCSFDGFSQVCGQLLGRHQLAAAVSPGKTIEGSMGGLLFAIGMALALRPLIGTPVFPTVLASCFISVAALTGDLLASLIKRKSGVKDFGNLLPGHGGILDRFDSFLFAAAACFVTGFAGRVLLQKMNLPR